MWQRSRLSLCLHGAVVAICCTRFQVAFLHLCVWLKLDWHNDSSASQLELSSSSSSVSMEARVKTCRALPPLQSLGIDSSSISTSSSLSSIAFTASDVREPQQPRIITASAGKCRSHAHQRPKRISVGNVRDVICEQHPEAQILLACASEPPPITNVIIIGTNDAHDLPVLQSGATLAFLLVEDNEKSLVAAVNLLGSDRK